MNENLDLRKILEGCKGIKLYSPILGEVTLTEIFPHEIQVTSVKDTRFGFGFNGRYFGEKYPDGECLLFPSKYQRNWSKFVKPIPKDTPFMVCDVPDAGCGWHLYFYANYDEEYEQHRVFLNGEKSKADYNKPTTTFKYMIPFDKFDANDIEESLKYNIQI